MQEKVVSSNVVMRVQGKLPTTPHSLYGSPRVSDTAAYDMRYLSISTIDMLFPSPTYEEVKDHDIEHFYSAVPDWYELRPDWAGGSHHERAEAVSSADLTDCMTALVMALTGQSCGCRHSYLALFSPWQGPHVLDRHGRQQDHCLALQPVRPRLPDLPRLPGETLASA